jgi:hypothetical protein
VRTLILILFLLLSQQELEYKWGIPTTEGINNYVERNEYQFVVDYQEYIGDTLINEPFISTDDLSDYVGFDERTAGFFERPDNIVISNETRYVDYELRRWNEERKNRYRGNNMFVRGVVMHELTHAYFYQVTRIAEYEHDLEYEWRQGLRMIPVDNYYTEFIEEGFCEAVVVMMDEIIPYPDDLGISKADLSPRNRSRYEVKYVYSSKFVKPIIDEYGLKAAIYLVVSNKPPSLEEILDPKTYYDRLKWK